MMGLVMLGLLGLTTTLFKAAGRPLSLPWQRLCRLLRVIPPATWVVQARDSRSGLQLLVFCYGKLLTVW